MKGDFSRLTGKRANREHYNSVLKQQGRVQLDSDWNELIEIIAGQRRTRTIDTIGQCGAPVHNSGFKISHPGNGLQDFLISTGRIYVGGLLCELNPTAKIAIIGFPANNKITVDNLKLNGDSLSEGQWIAIFTDESPQGKICKIKAAASTNLQLEQNVSDIAGETNPCFRRLIPYSEQEDYPDAPSWNPVSGQTDLVYLDVWDRHMTALEDPEIRETALGGPDTDTRLKTIAQVKVFPNVGDVDCPDSIPGWEQQIAAGLGRLKIQVAQSAPPPTPCELGESGGYNGLENHLYRVEIHEGGALGTAKFKWSRDNGSVAYSIDEFLPGNKIKLKQIGRDDVLKIQEKDWLEISDDGTELDTEKAGTIVQVLKVDENVLTLNADVSAHKDKKHPTARRWNTESKSNSPLIKTSAGEIDLEYNIKISFSGGPFRTGDFWVFTARASTGEVQKLEYELPYGVKHNYCKLALVTWGNDGTAKITDCRPEFEPLTEITDYSCCTVTVGKHGDFDDIQSAVDRIGEGPGTICILPGTYDIREPITIKGKDITIRGCGNRTLILNLSQSSDTAIVFSVNSSRGIVIKDLWAVSLNGDRAIVSSQSEFVTINDCVIMALGGSENSGAIVFHGNSIAGEVRNSLITGIVGIRFEPTSPGKLQYHASVKIEQNTIFALQSAILQLAGADFLECRINKNRLYGYESVSLMKVCFPLPFLDFAKKYGLFDANTLNQAKAVNRKTGGIATVTKSATAPIYNLADHLNLQATAEPSGDAVSTVIYLNSYTMETSIRENTMVGEVGVSTKIATKSMIGENSITASEDAISMGDADGFFIGGNKISAGKSGIRSIGVSSNNIGMKNNRISAGEHGIAFSVTGHDPYHQLDHIEVESNIIRSSDSGISVDDRTIIIEDFIALGNSIMDCDNHGIILNGLVRINKPDPDEPDHHRIIKRNLIRIQGIGIKTNITGVKVIDNDISVTYAGPIQEADKSYGIIIEADDCTIVNNNVQGIVIPEKQITTKGGILINPLQYDEASSSAVIEANRIKGGIGNGIEIASELGSGRIDGNKISDMNLNGVAAREDVKHLNCLIISNNEISDCNRFDIESERWWRYAGIVLGSCANSQILGNNIHDNGRKLKDPDIEVGGIFVELASCLTIADNHFIDIGPEKQTGDLSQAIIHIPGRSEREPNDHVKLIGNLVKGSMAPALILGKFWKWAKYENKEIRMALDLYGVISNNDFGSLAVHTDRPTVQLQCSLCVFSNNLVTSRWGYVDLGYGWYMTVIGNITGRPITGAGLFQENAHNLSII